MHTYEELYIDGTWVTPVGRGTIDVVDAATETRFATIPEGAPADIDRAVAAARRAFPAWADLPPAERGARLRGVADALAARRDELAGIIAHEVGMPKHQAMTAQVGGGINGFAAAAELAASYAFEDTNNGVVVKEPVGVVGCITPWNYPLNQIGAKVAYALAAGCTVVLKPSEVAPVNAFVLTEVIAGAGFPAGVYNLVSGYGPVVGEALAAHPDVDMMSFTGSTRAGRRVAELSAATVKKVALELGGKSPFVILDDADFPSAVATGVDAAYENSGQTCDALTRMLVPRSRLAEVEDLARAAAESYTVGDPFDERTQLGPLISAVQLERVRAYIERGVTEGATLLTGGADPPDGLDTGYFVRPTVFSNVTRDMTIAQEEIFGPVLSIIPYDTEEEAIDIANDTVYGLFGAVAGSDPRARAVARRIRAGQVRVNDGRGFRGAPFGGYKQSGLGRENGAYGLDEFLEVKALFV
ncbi:MAG TPA: aldehyde dehydrogenase family protein [Acidimicrobiia bacterium]|nr:aldehyde dehydrogenase family protein [Acidimicrobiia bacterium]